MGYPKVFMAPRQNIVVFERPSDDIINKYQLAAEGDIAHVVVMQHITRSRIDGFCRDLRKSLHPDRVII
jgi:histidine decarboxylase